MLFTNYKSSPFVNLNKTPTTLLTADANTIVVCSIIVTNLGKQTIRFNLKKTRNASTDIEHLYFPSNGLEIPPADVTHNVSGTVDVLKTISNGTELVLEYQASPSIVDSLSCYSNSTTQKFNCEIIYAQLNEVSYTG